jgi:hypothetical protein
MHKSKMTRKQARDKFKKATKMAKRMRKSGEKFSSAVKRAYKKV